MAVTYFGTATNPADNGTLATAAVTITPPASMTAGDLVVCYCTERNTTHATTNTVTGGQTWNYIDCYDSGNMQMEIFWCTFNGTWSADPEFTFSGTTNNSVQMLVARPTGTSYTWGVDQAFEFNAETTVTTMTRAGQTITNSSGITFASFQTVDDNTLGNLTGTGWNVAGGAQYRNLAGNDNSKGYAYFIHTSASSSTGTVTLDQLTLGPDNNTNGIITFYEIAGTRRRTNVT